MIVNTGKHIVLYLLEGDITTDGFPDYIGIGTGSTGEQASDTALETEVESRVQVTPTRDENNKKITMEVTITCTGTHNITEIGVFSASSGGNMFTRKTRTAIGVVNGTELTIQISVTVA